LTETEKLFLFPFDSNFEDIDKNAYYYNEVGIVKELGITKGIGNNRFNPTENITRQDMMVLSARVLEKLKNLKVAEFSDVLDKFTDKMDIAENEINKSEKLIKSPFDKIQIFMI